MGANMNDHVAKFGCGRVFDLGPDEVTIIVSGNDTDGSYSLMRFVVGPDTNAPNHIHEPYEETFYLLDGTLQFTLGRESFTLNPGDFVRVPPNTRHGYRNVSGQKATMLVSLLPGGFEESFYELSKTKDLAGFLKEAKEVHGTVYEPPSDE